MREGIKNTEPVFIISTAGGCIIYLSRVWRSRRVKYSFFTTYSLAWNITCDQYHWSRLRISQVKLVHASHFENSATLKEK